MTDIRTVERLSKLDQEIKEKEHIVKELKRKRDMLASLVAEYFTEHGIPSLTSHGRTVYLRVDLWAGREDGVSMEAASQALKEAGLGAYTKDQPNSQGLSALIREMAEHGEDFLETYAALKGVIKVSEVITVASRKAPAGSKAAGSKAAARVARDETTNSAA